MAPFSMLPFFKIYLNLLGSLPAYLYLCSVRTLVLTIR